MVGAVGILKKQTGSLRYDTAGVVRRIPAAALSGENAMLLRRMGDCGERPVITLMMVFFSSRRRHTRLVSDWSSDVCSSDLFVLFADDDIVFREDGVRAMLDE